MNAFYLYHITFPSPVLTHQHQFHTKIKKEKEMYAAEVYICITRFCELKKVKVQMSDRLLKMPWSILNSRLDPAQHNSC